MGSLLPLFTTIGWPDGSLFLTFLNDRMAGWRFFPHFPQRSDGRKRACFSLNLNDRMAGGRYKPGIYASLCTMVGSTPPGIYPTLLLRVYPPPSHPVYRALLRRSAGRMVCPGGGPGLRTGINYGNIPGVLTLFHKV